MFKFTLERQISFAFIVAFLILVTISVFSYQSVSQLTYALQRQKQTQQLLKNLDETLILVLNSETSGRGYLLTGKENFLEPYEQSKNKIVTQIEDLKIKIGENSQQLQKLSLLNVEIDKKLNFTKSTIELNRNGNIKSAVEQTNTGRGKELMDNIRQLINEIEAEEVAILDNRESELSNSVKNTYLMLLLGSLGGIVSLTLANFVIFRETTKRSKAETDLKQINKNLEGLVRERTAQLSTVNYELQEKSDFVQVTLDSLSANIAVVDNKGEILNVNEQWNNFAEENSGINHPLNLKIGENYLEICRLNAENDEVTKELLENLENILNGQQKSFRIEYPYYSAKKKHWFILQINSLQNAANNAVISHFDISDRKKIENDLRNSEEFNRSVFENNPDCVNVLETDGTLISMNKNGMKLMEIDDFAEFVGTPWLDFWVEEEKQTALKFIKKSRLGGAEKFAGYCRTAKNNLKYWEVSINPILDEAGKPIRLVASQRDATTRKEAEQERERLLESEKTARRDAEIANRMRDEFLATVSHELRAPLNSILGWGKMLQQGKLDEETKPKAIETIVRNALSQNRMIEDLLDVSRIISGKVRLEITKVRLSELIEVALEGVKPAADAKNIQLEFIEDSKVSHVSGDPNRLQQVIWNLLSNAIKFTPNDGKVTIEIKRLNGEITISITDTGIGIKEDFLPFVFKRFRQADPSMNRKFGGLGLGLAIVRHITEMHGGTVDVRSDGENKGSTFIVTLSAMYEINRLDEEKTSKEYRLEDLLYPETNVKLDGLLILVVDDEADARQMLVQALTLHGATVITASSAQEALAELEVKTPDVIVSDIGMPEEDGYSLMQKIRALPNEKANIPAVALTAFTRYQDRARALTAGFQNHVAKPVEVGELAVVIASITGRL